MKTARDILISIVNATIMLAIILVVCLIILLNKVTDMRDTTIAMLSTQTERIAELTSTVNVLNDKIGQCGPDSVAALRAEISTLGGNLPDLSGLNALTVRGIAVQIVDVAGERLAGIARIVRWQSVG